MPSLFGIFRSVVAALRIAVGVVLLRSATYYRP